MSRIKSDLSCFSAEDRETIKFFLENYKEYLPHRMALSSYFLQTIDILQVKGESYSDGVLTAAYMLGIIFKDINPEQALSYFLYAMGPDKTFNEPLAKHEYAKLLLKLYPNNPDCLSSAHQLFQAAAASGLEAAKISASVTAEIINERRVLLQQKIQQRMDVAPLPATTQLQGPLDGIPTGEIDLYTIPDIETQWPAPNLTAEPAQQQAPPTSLFNTDGIDTKALELFEDDFFGITEIATMKLL